MTKQKTIYELGLHESLSDNGIIIWRVAGGWIYNTSYYGGSSDVFVPYSEEFLPEDSPFIKLEKDYKNLSQAAHEIKEAMNTIAYTGGAGFELKDMAQNAISNFESIRRKIVY